MPHRKNSVAPVLNNSQYRATLDFMKILGRTLGRTFGHLLVLLGIAAVIPTKSIAGEPVGQGISTREPTEKAERDPLQKMSTETLIGKAREAIRTLGSYRVRLIKTERIKGEVRPPQTIEVLVCPAPRAVRLEYVAGPKAGRRVIWREDRRPTEILVREAGLLGLTSIWLNASGGLARGDTNHSASEIGFANVLDVMERDFEKAKANGGHVGKDLGRDGNGLYRIEWVASPAAIGLYARRLRLGIDERLHIPVDIEVFDAQGFLERYEYKNVRSRQSCKPSDLEDL